LFFVTRTKVGKPNSNICTEFKYVVISFLSGKVFKWHASEVWRKLVFMLYDREYIHYLKCNNGWLSAIFCLWNISSQSNNNQLAYLSSICLGSGFPWWKYPGEITLHTHCSAPGFSRKKSKWQSKKRICQDILPPIV